MTIAPKPHYFFQLTALVAAISVAACSESSMPPNPASGIAAVGAATRTRISVDEGWRFIRNDPEGTPISLLYDVRQTGGGRGGSTASAGVIKNWILPSGNPFLSDPSKGPTRPEGNLGEGVSYISPTFDDNAWRLVDLPHDYAIEGPFATSGDGGTGKLPYAGVAWYRKNLTIPASAADKERARNNFPVYVMAGRAR